MTEAAAAARARANAAQLAASDPAVSAFVSASAGSGKTKLLTDRLLRLMLAGVDPARILCLTFTKAAAAEMAIRLHRRLGRWVILADDALDRELAALGVGPSAVRRDAARALFARVLDLPGGMRIGTIHAFCQSVLRRFPLEANLSPHFQVMTDTDADIAAAAARESVLAGAHGPDRRAALTTLAGLLTERQFGDLVDALQQDRARLQGALDLGPERLAEVQRRALGVAEADEAAIVTRAVAAMDEATLSAVLRVLADRASDTIRDRALKLLDWLTLPTDVRAEHWAAWREGFLTNGGKPRAASTFVNPRLARERPDLADVLLAEQARVVAVEDDRQALAVATLSSALATLAGPVVAAYAGHKDGTGLLDYGDLIDRSGRLLVDPGAAWVLYKLDGGLDHLLLDEVQDTAPAQWAIAGALTAEFFAGLGAHEAGGRGPRTVFAVGDPKQSIFGFQGADPDGFETWRGRLRQRVAQVGAAWRDGALDVSFRSTAPVLALVDAVFANPDAASGVAAPGMLAHRTDRAGQAGWVALWPLAPQPEVPAAAAWELPDQNLEAEDASQRLADGLARWIAGSVGRLRLPSRDRLLAPGDILVLVRRRNRFTRALVRALKAAGVPVAGLDRMVLTEQPAVADLLALIDTLLLPGDDLSLATVLTSPLGGLTDDDLLALAPGRPGSLWDALRARRAQRPAWEQAWGFLSHLLGRADFVTPAALLAEALGTLGGRARLLARMGPEAAEPVDELLRKALEFTAAHPPSLQGFAHWLRQSAAEVKREAEGAGDTVRVMTVHGAKGLQAPLVILPDTTGLPKDDTAPLWASDPATNSDVAVPIWSPHAELRGAAVERLRDAAARRRADEHNRLLYVALTRAEDALIVCGAAPRQKPPDTCWYELVRRGFSTLGAEAAEPPAGGWSFGWDGPVLRHRCAQMDAPDRVTPPAATVEAGALPIWAGAAPDWVPLPPPAEPALPRPLAPSRPEGAGLAPVPGADSPLPGRDVAGQRFRRGQLAHSLLQHLPAVPPADRAAAAQRLLAAPSSGLTADQAAALASEVMAILDHPDLGPLFGPASRAEAPLTGVVAGVVIGGVLDRLAVLSDRVLVADYKTNRAAPSRAWDTPMLYLRQMAAYRALLREIFPGRAVVCALVWTAAARVSILPDAVLDAHAPAPAA